MMRFADSIFFQKNKIFDSDENEIQWEGYLWHELEVPTLVIDFGVGEVLTQMVSH